ncbi:MAG: hypothetical protein A3H97_19885 [Acidobacteria bacterium RIFCSPLOWO2_02_FULL_65_29]|nr:MAG: hypothetical protein A3H97_19885 [Acidobacteria bacterium RIFCSPLOWO2_02_FULL_65_29]
MPARRFSRKAIAFLRALKRNNRREWFTPRKDQYEELLRTPMLEIVEQLALDFRSIAPELSAGPKSVFRIYRDTRFSSDKSPYKTNVSAVFPHKDLPKLGGAGLYFEVTPTWVWVGGGLHTPDGPMLQKEREHIAEDLRRFRSIVESPAFKRHVGTIEGGELLQRVPRGFAPDHPAAQYLRYRMFIAGREFPASFATTPKFYAGVLDVFRHMTPLIRFLNEPLVKR